MIHDYDFNITKLDFQSNFSSTKIILTTSLATGCPTVLILSSIGCRPCLIARVSVNSGRAAMKRENTPWAQDVTWTYIRRSEDVQHVFWTCYEHSVWVVCPRGYSVGIRPLQIKENYILKNTLNSRAEKKHIYFISSKFMQKAYIVNTIVIRLHHL